MKNWLTYLLIFFVVILQIALLPNFSIHTFYPNLIFLFLLSLLILGHDNIAIWWVIFGGLLLDLFSPFFFGNFCLQFLLVFFLYRFVIRPLIHEPSPPLVLLIFAVISIFTVCFDSFITRQSPLPVLLVAILYQSIIGFIIYFILSKVLQNRHRIRT